MQLNTQQRLLALNRDFYLTVADEFDSTRLYVPPGMSKASEFVGQFAAERPPDLPLTVLDAGCGNGRFAWALNTLQRPCQYIGVDLNPRLLELAQGHVASLPYLRARFFCADISQPTWLRQLTDNSAADWDKTVDLIGCFAVLHHFPGYDLRQRIVKQLAGLLQTGGLLITSNWQCLSSQRFVQKQIEWVSLAIDPADLDACDVLLPWNQGAHAIRYIHQIDEEEMQRLAQDAGLQIEASYRIDGKEGNLNLYAVLRKM
jgi:SAM-dependent methyltransferase